jgi:hypothetical protein
MIPVDDDPPWPLPPGEGQQWACGPFGFWPLAFPWGDGISWGMAGTRRR